MRAKWWGARRVGARRVRPGGVGPEGWGLEEWSPKPRKSGGPKRWEVLRRVGPEGWGQRSGRPKGGGPQSGGPKGGGPKFRFFFFSRLNFHSLWSLWASFCGISVVFEVLGPSKMHVWSSLGHRVRAPAGPRRG